MWRKRSRHTTTLSLMRQLWFLAVYFSCSERFNSYAFIASLQSFARYPPTRKGCTASFAAGRNGQTLLASSLDVSGSAAAEVPSSPPRILLNTQERLLRRVLRLNKDQKSEFSRSTRRDVPAAEGSDQKHKNANSSSIGAASSLFQTRERPDSDQLSSIKTTAPAVLLRAGPGTGKSRVLSSRIAYLLRSESCAPSNLIVLSFAKHDAKRIKTNALRMLRESGYFESPLTENIYKEAMWSGTFHGLASAIIRKYSGGGAYGIKVYSDRERKHLISACLQRFSGLPFADSRQIDIETDGTSDNNERVAKLLSKRRLYRQAEDACGGSLSAHSLRNIVEATMRSFELWKEAGILPPPFTFSVSLDDEGGDSDAKHKHARSREKNVRALLKESTVRENAIESASRLGIPTNVALLALEIFPNYQALSYATGKVDPADLVPLARELLTSSPEALSSLREKLRHAIVDEYQDISVTQRALLRLIVLGSKYPMPSWSTLLASSEEACADAVLSDDLVASSCWRGGSQATFDVPKIFCAGDANQSIYGWRGAAPSLTVEGFLSDFPQGVVIPLGTSYRLPQHILSAASVLMVGGQENLEPARERAAMCKSMIETYGRQAKPRPIRSFEVSPAAKKAAYDMIVEIEAETSSSSESPKVDVSHQQLGEELLLRADTNQSKVVVKGLWDAREEAKWIATSIKNRFSARQRFLASVRSGDRSNANRIPTKGLPGNAHFDTSDVCIMVRCNWQIRIFEEALRNAGIPFVVERPRARASKEEFRGGTYEAESTSTAEKEEKISGLEGSHSKGKQSTLKMVPVRIMTMHRAKGEEFDDIYLAGWEEGIFPHPAAVGSNRLHEERRLGYIALTRARQRAVITYSSVRKRPRSSGVEQVRPSRFLCELVPKDGPHAPFLSWNQRLGIKDIIAGQNLPEYFSNSYRERSPALTDDDEYSPEAESSATVSEAKKRDMVDKSNDDAHGTAMPPSRIEPVKLDAPQSNLAQDLSFVRKGLEDIMLRRRGACKKLRPRFRDMLGTIFGIKRGRIPVIAAANDPKDDSISRNPFTAKSQQLGTRPISRCTALELGRYLEHLIAERNNK